MKDEKYTGTFTGTSKDVMRMYELIGKITAHVDNTKNERLIELVTELDALINKTLIPF